MRYEVTQRVEDGFSDTQGRPVFIRIYPEETPPGDMFTAMILAAYEMKGTPGLGGLATINSPKSVSPRDVRGYLCYVQQDPRTFWQRLRGVPDTRVPSSCHADYINGYAIKLHIDPSRENPDTFEMYVPVFEWEVGGLESLMTKTERLLPTVREQLATPPTFRQRLVDALDPVN